MPHKLELQAVARQQFTRGKIGVPVISFIALSVFGIGNAFANKLDGGLNEKQGSYIHSGLNTHSAWWLW
jgi:hypothetical protein